MKPCTRCNGEKIIHTKGFTTSEGKILPDRTDSCFCCGGKGEFPSIDTADILTRITATKGKNKGRIRASMVSPWRKAGHEAVRAYYVWRLARFHGGKDMTLPMAADMIVRGDPYKKELDELADQVAKNYFGSDMKAALRWGHAFGMV